VTTEPGSGTPMSNPPEPAPAMPGSSGDESTSDLLQSMLSRAVEGQLGDQRELTSAVGDMRTQLMRLSQELAEMRVRPAGEDNADAQLNNVTVEMREAVRFLSERLDGVTRMVAQRGEELADIRTALTAIDAHVRSQAETIGVLSAGLQALPSYGERVSVLQDNLQVLHRQLVGIEGALAATEDNTVGERLSSIEAALASSKDDHQVLHRLTAIEAGLAAPSDDHGVAERLAAIESSVAPLIGRLDEVSDTGTAQSALLSQLQTSTSQLHLAVTGLQSRVDPIAEDITAIGSEVTGLVEGSADGAALDSRVSESVSQAVRETEHRLMAHIDEAVVALAQTLLKRRMPSAASQITGTPIVETPPAAPPVAEPVAAGAEEPADDQGGDDEGGDAAHAALTPADEAESTTESATDLATEPAEPPAWWERDLGAVGGSQVEASHDELDDPSTEAHDHDPHVVDSVEPAESDLETHDLDEPDPAELAARIVPSIDPDEASPTDHWAPPVATPGVGVSTEADDVAEVDDDEPTRLPEQADDAETAPFVGRAVNLAPPEPAPAADTPPASESWLPQTPPERNPADPTVTLEPQKRKWGRRNR
jgi:hypothetical protein